MARREELNCLKPHNLLEMIKEFKFCLSDSKLHSSLRPYVRWKVDRLDVWGVPTPPSVLGGGGWAKSALPPGPLGPQGFSIQPFVPIQASWNPARAHPTFSGVPFAAQSLSPVPDLISAARTPALAEVLAPTWDFSLLGISG